MEGSKYSQHNQTNNINIGKFHVWINSIKKTQPQDVVAISALTHNRIFSTVLPGKIKFLSAHLKKKKIMADAFKLHL